MVDYLPTEGRNECYKVTAKWTEQSWGITAKMRTVGQLVAYSQRCGGGGGELSWFAHQVEQCMLLSDGQKGCAICERLRTEVRR